MHNSYSYKINTDISESLEVKKAPEDFTFEEFLSYLMNSNSGISKAQQIEEVILSP